jgi:hypothetical protein
MFSQIETVKIIQSGVQPMGLILLKVAALEIEFFARDKTSI